MTQRRDRLIRCFSAVFPGLAVNDIPDARIESVGGWDSLAALRLVALFEEEFGLRMNLSDLQTLGSFGDFEQYLKEHDDRT